MSAVEAPEPWATKKRPILVARSDQSPGSNTEFIPGNYETPLVCTVVDGTKTENKTMKITPLTTGQAFGKKENPPNPNRLVMMAK